VLELSVTSLVNLEGAQETSFESARPLSAPNLRIECHLYCTILLRRTIGDRTPLFGRLRIVTFTFLFFYDGAPLPKLTHARSTGQ